MTKKQIALLVVGFIFLIFLFRNLGIVRVYEVPSSSNEPNLKVGSSILGTSLIKPKRLDFAYFKFSDSLEGWTIVKRLIALPGDTLYCRDGYYFVNGENLDVKTDLRFAYKMLPEIFNSFILDKISNPEYYKYYNSDSVIAFLDNTFVERLPFKLERKYDKTTLRLSQEIFNEKTNWTLNNFGPIIIPDGKYFFSGDSRDNSIDSRFREYVDGNNILGTVVFNF